MKFYAGVTDTSWYNYLSKANPEDVNFWQPGGQTSFRVLEQFEPFLFKLKAPYNVIGGVGFLCRSLFFITSDGLESFWDKKRSGFIGNLFEVDSKHQSKA